jgi:predicted AAA+ superfamily ATPase
LLIGPRQAGKTYLMRQLEQQIRRTGGQTLFLNLDIEAEARFFQTQQALLDKIRLSLGQTGTVFIDEIQRKTNAGLFLKGIYDMGLPYKLVVSGSGSLELKEKIAESLAGRKRVFEITPVDFWEFADYQTGYRYSEKMGDYLHLESEAARSLLEEYLTFGGYPRVVLAVTAPEKKAQIEEIYRSFLERDIKDLLGVEKTEAFTHLVKAIAAQIGSLVNVSEVSNLTGLAVTTVNHYLWYLEKTFILRKVTPFYRNVRREITSRTVYYFTDLGLRNYLLGVLSEAALSLSAGFLFQNLVFQGLREIWREEAAEIHYWRTKDDAEVDFVVENGAKLLPVEAKYAVLKKPEITRSFRSFLEKYHPKTAVIVHLGKAMTEKIGQTTVNFVPFWDLALGRIG